MENLSNKIFFCYSWEDLTNVLKVVDALRHELDSDIEPFRGNDNTENIEETVYPLIDEADIVLIFISDLSKNSQYVKQCSKYAQNANKHILPIEIGKNSVFSSMPDELKFRTRTIEYKDENQRQQFFGQMKAIFGVSVEGGDNYGSAIHISTDVNVTVSRYGKELCVALAGQDSVIRLNKGMHKLIFTNKGNSKESFSKIYEVKSNEGEQFLEITFRKEIANAERQKEIEKEKERKKQQPISTQKKVGIIAATLIFVIAIVWGINYYNNIYIPEKIDREASHYYVLPNSLFIRSSEISGIENKLASVFYGQELITYRHGDEWSKVKYKKIGQRGKEGVIGYVGSRYLLTKQDFFIVNSIWGNEDAKVIAETNKIRLALLDYYKSHGYIGKMSDEILAEAGITIIPDRNNQWQFFGLPKKSKYNNAFFKKIISSNQKYPDAFIILKNPVTTERKLVVFHYDDDETPHFVAEFGAPERGLIKNIKNMHKDNFGEIHFDVEYCDE